MSKSQTLRALVNERLTAAAEEIFALFERTIAEYEEEVCRSKEENQRKQELLDSILSPSKSPGPGLNQDPPHTPRIKLEPEEPQEPEEPEEPRVKQEDHALQNLLVKVECRGVKQFVQVPDVDGTFNFSAFLQEVTHTFHLPERLDLDKLCVTDETGTEVDEDVFDELMKSGVEQLSVHCRYPVTDDPSMTLDFTAEDCDGSKSPASPTPSLLENVTSFLSNESAIARPSPRKRKEPPTDMDRTEALQTVQSALKSHPKGTSIFREYFKTKRLSDRTRRLMVNILVTAMIDSYGKQPPRCIRTAFARGIVALFPNLQDPFSRNGFEHFYDPISSTGYLAWRLKTVQRKSSDYRPRLKKSRPVQLQCSPTTLRLPLVSEDQLHGEECAQALSLLSQSVDKSVVREKMRATFKYRQNLVHNREDVSSVFDVFPRFLDTPGLIEQDFSLLFGDEISEKFISKWPLHFKPKVISECQKIPNLYTCELLSSLESSPESEQCWDSDVTSLLLLLHLLPPTPRGPQKMAKISSAQAASRLFRFVKKGRSVSTFLETVEQRQPFLLCVGERKKHIEEFFVVIDQTALPCAAESTLAAFDALFKAHYVFCVPYDPALAGFYTFIQTTVYNIDVGLTKETPRVRELRARIL
ncbi:uncharacterized protein LOC110172807 [Boleophthalmus pectinirostris]|uniref:uncharacterized protein LOC110172807 n=1 Tax=Boleophthalmus pectinirostris TaxID=150288 RepID=UPI00242FD145|nr:uncharacterized protein LOC110172807 [Boleophthalmus pectinirostris]